MNTLRPGKACKTGRSGKKAGKNNTICGYGLKNVTTILDKKGGNIIFHIREGQFMAEVTIKNK